MKHGFVKVGAVTPEIVVANSDFNAKSIISLIEEGEKNGAEDVKKARWYLDKYLELEGEDH